MEELYLIDQLVENGRSENKILEIVKSQSKKELETQFWVCQAYQNGLKSVVEYFFNEEIELSEEIGRSLLSSASEAGDLEMMKFLVEERNVEVNPVKNETMYPLVAAILKRKEKAIQYLLENGASLIPERGLIAYPLRQAVTMGDRKIIELLIKHGADMKDERNYLVVLDALRQGDASFMNWILEHGANANIQLSGWDEINNFGSAISTWNEEKKEALDVLISAGFDVNLQDLFGNTIFHFLVKNNLNFYSIEYLIEKGGDPHRENKYGKKPVDLIKPKGRYAKELHELLK